MVLASCTSKTGEDAAATSSPPDAAAAQLDTGSYATTPAAPVGTAGTRGSAVEARRMADHVTGPWQVQAALIGRQPLVDTLKTGPSDGGADRLRQLLPEGLAPVATTNGLITGFSSFRSADAGAVKLVNAVLRFSGPDAATTAAAALSDALEYRPLPIDNRPATRALVDRQGDLVFAAAFTPRGPFVLYQSTLTKPSANDPDQPAVELISGALDLQEPLIDGFQPTEVAQLGELAKDPSGTDLLSRTLVAADDRIPGLSAGVWQPAGWLHFEDNPLAAAPLLADAGVEWVAQLLGTVYQARDGDGAATLADGLVAAAAALPDVTATTGVAGLPAAHCFERTAGAAPATDSPSVQRMAWRFKCIATVDRYVFSTFSQAETDVKQQISAQYRLLADG